MKNKENNRSRPSSDFDLAALEAVLFLAAEPLSLAELSNILDFSTEQIISLLRSLHLRLWQAPGALCLRQLEEKYYLSVKPEFQEVASAYFRPDGERRLSPQSYEVLAAVAYLQPATRAQIEAVRGVNSDHIINRLQVEGLLEEAGKLDLPGRPQSFKVSQKFWQEFGYSGVEDLPSIDLSMYTDLQDISQA
ncbi:MAG: SMC-Scp complex subunit ScpB [Eubacteriales bacterium]|nr:SMC-Scp complex subunit ScpB [Eubacteriales bacterium]